jgi:hypothetical protein
MTFAEILAPVILPKDSFCEIHLGELRLVDSRPALHTAVEMCRGADTAILQILPEMTDLVSRRY